MDVTTALTIADTADEWTAETLRMALATLDSAPRSYLTAELRILATLDAVSAS